MLNPFNTDYERRLEIVLGDSWRTGATLNKKLSPFSGLELFYYRIADEKYFHLICGKGLHVLKVFESELAYKVASEPVKYTADFRETFAYAPEKKELYEQIEVLLDFWRTNKKLNLSKPLVFKRPGLGDKLEVEYQGYEIALGRSSRFNAQIKMNELDGNTQLSFDLIHFTPEWTDIIPCQLQHKQLSLFS